LTHWKKLNFADVEDVSPDGVSIQWHFARKALGSPELGVSRFTYEPGARMPWGHRHNSQEEIYVVVSGGGRAKLEEEIIELEPWDVIRVGPSVARSMEAGPDGMEVICIGGHKAEGQDGILVEDFWP